MNVSNRLSEDAKIIGTLIVKEDLFIDCEVEGEIKSSGNLTIGENSKITGKVDASSVIVFGKIDGDIESQNRCELKESSEINGNVKAATLKIIEGASFNGSAQVIRK